MYFGRCLEYHGVEIMLWGCRRFYEEERLLKLLIAAISGNSRDPIPHNKKCITKDNK